MFVCDFEEYGHENFMLDLENRLDYYLVKGFEEDEIDMDDDEWEDSKFNHINATQEECQELFDSLKE